jgi:pyruvate carboxylase
MAEPVLLAIVAAMSALAGSLITTFVQHRLAIANESRRRRHQREDELLKLKREAITAALQWIDLFKSAEIRATGITLAASGGDVPTDDIRAGFPAPLKEISKLDLPGHLRVVLPPGAYQQGSEILRHFDELRALAIASARDYDRNKTYDHQRFNEIMDQVEKLRSGIDSLEEVLRDSFSATFA